MGTPEQTAASPAGSDIFGEYGGVVSCASAVILMLAILAIDKLTGYDLHLGILQLIPVAIVTWFAGRAWGLALSLAAVGIWLVMFRTSHHYSVTYYYVWDGLALLGTLVVFVYLLARLREALSDSDARFVKALEDLDAAVYVADPAKGEVLYGNRHFRETEGERSFDVLARQPARECAMRWTDGRPVVLRILAGPAH